LVDWSQDVVGDTANSQNKNRSCIHDYTKSTDMALGKIAVGRRLSISIGYASLGRHF
jgi:hypothetical protein